MIGRYIMNIFRIIRPKDNYKTMLDNGWIDIKLETPPSNIAILIAFREYGIELNNYKARESVRRGVFYYIPDFNNLQSTETFYNPDFWRHMPACL